jgi:hypothetical protein
MIHCRPESFKVDKILLCRIRRILSRARRGYSGLKEECRMSVRRRDRQKGMRSWQSRIGLGRPKGEPAEAARRSN